MPHKKRIGNAAGRETWATGLRAAMSNAYDKFITDLGLGDADIEAVVFLVMIQATQDMDQDLKMIMAEVKAMTNAKQKLRDLINKVNRDVARNSGVTEGKLRFQSDGMGSEAAYHRTPMPIPDPDARIGVRFIKMDLFKGKIDDVADLQVILEDLKGKLDSMNEMSEMTSLRLQMMMDRRSKMIETLSNIMKKISKTQDTLVENLK